MIVGTHPARALEEEVARYADSLAPGIRVRRLPGPRPIEPDDCEISTSRRAGMWTVIVVIRGEDYAEGTARDLATAQGRALDAFRRKRNDETNAILTGRPPEPPPPSSRPRLTVVSRREG